MKRKLYKSASETNLPLISTKSSLDTFVTGLTDDSYFALSQFNKINRIYSLRKIYNLKPWERINKNKLNSSDYKSNHTLLKQIKKKNTSSAPDIKNINWNDYNYYNSKELNNVFDAFQIIKYVNNRDTIRKLSKDKEKDLLVLSNQNKQICFTNIISEMLNNERKKISEMEKEKINALNNKTNDLDNDIVIFNEFKEKINYHLREKENILNSLIISNKKIYDNKKKLYQESRIYLDLIERYIREIIKLKKYAIFTHKLLGGKSPFLNSTLSDGIDIKNNRENVLEEYANKILTELNSLIIDNNEINDNISSILEDPEKIMYIFEHLEDNIMKYFNKNQEYLLETKNKKNEYENLFENLNNKINYLGNEYQLYKKEYDKMNIEINDFYDSQNKTNKTNFFSKLFNDIYESMFPDEKKVSEKGINEKINKLTLGLREIENKVNNFISDLENKENEDIESFKDIIENIKNENRLDNYLIERKKLENKLRTVKMKLEKKMNQFVFKGKHIYNNPIPPPHIIKKLKKKIEHINDDDNELDYILY